MVRKSLIAIVGQRSDSRVARSSARSDLRSARKSPVGPGGFAMPVLRRSTRLNRLERRDSRFERRMTHEQPP